MTAHVRGRDSLLFILLLRENEQIWYLPPAQSRDGSW